MARVALINPGKDQQYAIQEPLNLGFIASFLEKNNIEVKIIDELAGQDVKKELNKFSPEIAGITATTPLAHDAYRVAGICREKNIMTVMGGVHASVLPQEALSYVDMVVKGEGERAMLDIVKGNIPKGETIISRPYIKNIDDVPSPARHLMQMDFYLHSKDRMPVTYLYFVPPHTNVSAILTSRGCPYSCTFCHNTWKDMPYRFNSPERVIAEIDGLISRYGIKALFFIEDNFFVNKQRVETICKMLIRTNISIVWGANARVDNIDLKILKIAKLAGCRQVTFGFESGSQRILDILNKKTTVEQNKRAIELCNQIGIIPQGTFMIGNPQETLQDIRATQNFIKNNKIGSAGICLTTPYPGTELWDWCKKQQRIPEHLNWEDFNYGKIAIPVCNAIPEGELKRLFLETVEIASRKSHLKISQVFITSLLYPNQVINWLRKNFKRPAAIRNLLQRLRI